MTVRSEMLRDKNKSFIHEVIMGGSDDFFNNELSENCVGSNLHGFAIGKNEMLTLRRAMRNSFEFIDISNYAELYGDDILSYSCLFTLKHVGKYKNIEPTGKSIELPFVCGLGVEREKISFMYSAVQSKMIVSALTDGKASSHQKNNPSNQELYAVRFLKMTKSLFFGLGISISIRELQCLSLWSAGRSRTEIANILSITPKTVECYQARLREAFNCEKKEHVFGRVETMEVSIVLRRCLSLILGD